MQKGFSLIALLVSVAILALILWGSITALIPKDGEDLENNNTSPIEQAEDARQKLENLSQQIGKVAGDEGKETVAMYNTFEEAFGEIANIPKSPTSDFIEESRQFALMGRLIRETLTAPVYCLTEPCDAEPEPYDVLLFQDLVNKDYKIPLEEKYLSQFSLEVGDNYVIKGKVIYLRKYQEVKIVRFEPIEVLAR